MRLIAVTFWAILTICSIALLGVAVFVHTTNPFSWVIGFVLTAFCAFWYKTEIKKLFK